MEVISTLLSFLPFLMIVLFILRFVAGAGKKKRPSRLDSLRSYQAKNKAPEAPETEPVPENIRTETIAPSAAASETKTEPLIQPVMKQSGQIYKTTPPGPLPRPGSRNSRSRLEGLPELKKAVIWAEILGKPKGLR